MDAHNLAQEHTCTGDPLTYGLLWGHLKEKGEDSIGWGDMEFDLNIYNKR